ncbi:MAG: hypothetical protein IPO95_13090 [Rhodanobacteraceae bacterium]|nr:hypothetical protein [Rhodanobacteraceae bacterium]
MTARRRLWMILAAPALALAWLVLHIGVADLLVAQDPDAALAWWPHHDGAQLQLAEIAAEPGGDAAQAVARARAVLARTPLNGVAYRVLGRVADGAGDEAGALAHYRIAARRAPRDRPALGWLANHAVLHGDFTAALARTDQLLRVSPGLLDDTLPTLAALAAIPEARVALLRLLGEGAPPWRPRFLSWLSQQPGALPLITALFSPLRAAPQPLSMAERSAWIDRLLRETRVAEASSCGSRRCRTSAARCSAMSSMAASNCRPTMAASAGPLRRSRARPSIRNRPPGPAASRRW